MNAQLRITEEKVLLRICSEPYVLYTKRGYQPALDVLAIHSWEKFFLFISAISLSDSLYSISQNNQGKLKGIELVLSKASADRMAPYLVAPG